MSIKVCFREPNAEERREYEDKEVKKYELHPSCQQTHNITFATEHLGAKLFIMLSIPIIPQLLRSPGPSLQTLYFNPYCAFLSLFLQASVAASSVCVYVCSHVCKLQSQNCKSQGLQSGSLLWHSLTTPDRCVAASPRETSTFRSRKVACWVQPKHILPFSQETQGKVTGLCVCICVRIFMRLPEVCLSA